MESVKKYQIYLSALGVSPGDDAERVKQAFRKKIKIHHPDTAANPEDASKAQTLIEAYEAFKKGVPKLEVEGRSKSSGLYYRAEMHRKGHRVGHAATSEALGRAAARRVFDAVFKDRISPLSPLDDALGDLSEMLWGDVPETQVYGIHAAVREYRPPMGRGRRATASYIDVEEPIGAEAPGPESLEGSRRLFFETEETLRDIVHHFENAGRRRFTRAWVREYLGALAQVQIRFRDVSKYHPAFSARALRRVRQIGELMAEIKKSA